MILTVIIPTRNRSKLLAGSLSSLLNQTLSLQSFEVIVVDNGSTDNTIEVVENFKGKLPNCKYFYEPQPGLHVGRHKGLKEATTDILVFADDDIEAFPTWLEGVVESFSYPEVGLVGGKNLPKYESNPPDWVVNMWNAGCEYGHANGYLSILDFGNEIKEIHPGYVWGCNFAIRKKVLIEAGGFHPDGMPQDLIKYRGDGESYISQYVLNNKIKCVYNPKASIYHLVTNERLSLEYFKKRAYNQGISDSYTKIRMHGGIAENLNIENKGNSFTEMIRKSKRYFKNKLLVGTNQNSLQQTLQEYNAKGFLFHQDQVRFDEELLTWVLKENYY